MDQWTPDEVDAHLQFMSDFAARLEGTGEFVDGQFHQRRRVQLLEQRVRHLVGDRDV